MASAELLGVDVSHGTYGYDGQVDTDVYVENTGVDPHTFFVGYTVYGPNGDTYDNDATTGETVTIDSGGRERVTVSWDVESTAPEGSYDVRVSVWAESNPSNLQTRLADDREYDAFSIEEASVSAGITSVAVDGGTYSAGDTVDTDVRVENTGNVDHTYYVGYTVHGPDGDSYDNDATTGRPVSLDSGDERTVTVEWDAESDAPDGRYDVQVAVWKQSDPSDLVDRLDEEWAYDAFTIQSPEVRASIRSLDVDSGTYGADGTVDTDVRVENTGNVDHTYYVGYTVHGPDGDTYDNGDTTGTPLSLSPGEARTETVRWDVESDAPDGSYDVQVAVWKQSDPSDLVDRLDEEWAYDSFAVQRTEVQAALVDVDPPRGEYLSGDIVTTSVAIENTGNVDHTYYVGYTVFGPNGGEYDNEDTTGTPETIPAGDRRRVDLDWQVPREPPSGSYDVVVAVWKERDPASLDTRLDEVGIDDAFTVDGDGPAATASIVEFDVSTGAVTPGETVDGQVVIENTGEAEHTFFVGFSAIGPDGEEYDNDDTTGRPVTVARGDRRTVAVEWNVPSGIPEGAYDLWTAVWKESDRARLETRLDDAMARDAISVSTVTASAQIDTIDPAAGQYAEGQVATTTVEVTNTGEADHTFFVGYSVRGPDGSAYDNGGTTGQAVTIPAGDTRAVTLEWQVTREAPVGAYDAEIVVWAESDRSRLETPLAETSERGAFEVVDSLAAATIEAVETTRDPVAGGESVPLEARVRNDGETEHTFFVGFTLTGLDWERATDDPVGQPVALDAGDAAPVRVSWSVPADLPSGAYDLTVRVYSERDAANRETVLAERTDEEALTVANPDVSVVDVERTPSDGEITSFETTAVATAVLENTGSESTTVLVEHRIMSPDEALVVSTTDEVDIRPGATRRTSVRWEPSPDQDLAGGAYGYEATLRSSAGDQLVTRTLDDAFRVTIPAVGRTDFAVDVREASGNAVERATVDLSPVEGGDSFSQRLRDGAVEFDRIPNGLYELTVDHGDAALEESFSVWVSSQFSSAYLTVSAAKAISGSLVDDTGHQPVPDATVRLEGIGEATTGPLGTYSFDERVPDGTYDMTVEGSDGSTMRRSVTVNDSRFVGLTLDRPLVDQTQRELTPESDVITEENQIVTVFARYLQNTETEDIVLNGYTDLLHGVVKGVVGAITDIFESLKDAVMALLGLDLGEVLEAFAQFFDALWETRGGILFEIAKAVLASAVDGLEALHEQQLEDNPYEIPNPRAYVFLEGWYLGYIGFNLLLGWIAKVFTLGARGVLTASDAVTDALDRMTDVVRRLDRGDSPVDDPGAVSKFPVLRSQAAANAPTGLPVGGAVFGGTAVASYVQAAPHSGVLWDILDSLYRTNHRYVGRMDPDNPTGTFGNPMENIRPPFGGGDANNLVGKLAERVVAARFLDGRGELPKIDKILTDFEPRKLNDGERALLLNWKKEGSYTAEFDFLEIEMRQLDDGEDLKPVVVRNWESTGASDLESELEKKERTMQRVIDRTEAKGMQTPSSSGLSGDAFVRDGIPEVKLVDWKDELDVSGTQMRQVTAFVLRTADLDNDGFDLEDMNVDFDDLDFDIDDVKVPFEHVDFLFKPQPTDD